VLGPRRRASRSSTGQPWRRPCRRAAAGGWCPVNAGPRNAELLRAEALLVEETGRLAEWLRELTPKQTAAVEALTASIVNKLMPGPTVALRPVRGRCA
jgi:hypothetical protein